MDVIVQEIPFRDTYIYKAIGNEVRPRTMALQFQSGKGRVFFKKTR